jgi:endonuclease III
MLFSICVAGKPASRIAPLLERVLSEIPGETILAKALHLGHPERVRPLCEHYRIAPYKDRVPAIRELARRLAVDPLYLQHAHPDDIATIPGVSLKTSRIFVLHSRPDQRLAVLDTHILAWLRELGLPDIPKASPSTKSTYERLEKTILKICDATNCTPAALDLAIWRSRQKVQAPAVADR